MLPDVGYRSHTGAVGHMEDIRQKAEAIARAKYPLEALASDKDLPQILHELRIHQIELELQNEELRKLKTDQETAHQKYFQLYNYAPIGYLIFNKQGSIAEINLTGTRLLGQERQQLLNTPFILYLNSPSRELFSQHLSKVFNTKTTQTCELTVQPPGSGQIIQIQMESTPITSREDWVCFSALTNVSTTKQTEAQLKKALAEKEVLLKEVHHRVKNNLQIINSLLSLQAAGIEEPAFKQLFQESQSRIKSMSLIHELLYTAGNLAEIDFGVYMAALVNNLRLGFQHNQDMVQIITDADKILLDLSTAIPCGLILNELITNALKYAFPDNRSGEIRVSFKQVGQHRRRLTVQDNGVGLPAYIFSPDWTRVDITHIEHQALGLKLVSSLVQQLKGTATVQSGRGTQVVIDF